MNINKHLIPFCLWIRKALPSPYYVLSFPQSSDLPVALFTFFALLCLGTSALCHTMAGCAHRAGMVLSAKLDYVGIGWLISATVATVVWYGFGSCHPTVAWSFLGVCLATGICGNIFPFMKWFNMHEYRMYRIAFFLAMAISGLGPMIMLGVLHSWREAYDFVCECQPCSVYHPVLLERTLTPFFFLCSADIPIPSFVHHRSTVLRNPHAGTVLTCICEAETRRDRG